MRLEGWEAALNATVDRARHRPFKLGETDCLRFACEAVAALTGVDYWPLWEGRYSTQREMLRVISQAGDGSFSEAVSKTLGAEPVIAKLAQRGDLVMCRGGDGDLCLGVCIGEYTALQGEDGLIFLPTRDGVAAWRIS